MECRNFLPGKCPLAFAFWWRGNSTGPPATFPACRISSASGTYRSESYWNGHFISVLSLRATSSFLSGFLGEPGSNNGCSGGRDLCKHNRPGATEASGNVGRILAKSPAIGRNDNLLWHPIDRSWLYYRAGCGRCRLWLFYG